MYLCFHSANIICCVSSCDPFATAHCNVSRLLLRSGVVILQTHTCIRVPVHAYTHVCTHAHTHTHRENKTDRNFALANDSHQTRHQAADVVFASTNTHHGAVSPSHIHK